MSKKKSKTKIWVDLDNTPHVLFFAPIISDLESRGFKFLLTVRDAFQVCELADKKGLNCQVVGHHNGKNPLLKVGGLLQRALQLVPYAMREKPVLAISHGSRAQLLASRILRIPTLEFTDYEHAHSGGILTSTWLMAPEALADSELARKRKNSFRSYPGYKENVYASLDHYDNTLLKDLGVSSSDVIATVRPPATEAHYHNRKSERLLQSFMERALSNSGVKIIFLPRNKKQECEFRLSQPQWFDKDKVVVPNSVIESIPLINKSDLVVSGGGTMTREAAVIGVPAYSIFSGDLGAVDRNLAEAGQLVLIKSEQDIEKQISFVKRKVNPDSVRVTSKYNTRSVITDAIVDYVRLTVNK